MSCNEWKEVKLEEVIDFKNGKKKPNNCGDIPVYGGNGILGYVDSPNCNNIVIIGRVGAYCGSVYYEPNECWVSDNAIFAKSKLGNSTKYAYYSLSNLRLNEHRIGTGQPLLTQGILNNIITVYPDPKEQQAIVATLSCIDDKIELNNRINKTLEEMAQAIFKSWFVNFEPFQDGEFEDSELGRIPKGWRVGTISDLGDVIGGSTPSKVCVDYYTDRGIAWITPKDLSVNKDKFISKGEIDITELGLKKRSTRVMPKGTVLFSSRAPIGYIAIAKNDVTTNQGFKSVVPKRNIGTPYVYYFLKNNVNLIENRASGSTFKEVSGSVMKQIPAVIPADNVLKEFENICGLYFEKQRLLEGQNRQLSGIRDTLLPKLMSGEIRVPLEEVQ